MVFGQPLNHLLQSHHACRGKNACLAHAAAQQFAHTMNTFDKGSTAHDHCANWSAQPFGETEHHRIDAAYQFAHWHSQGNSRVKDARPIHMYSHTMRMRQIRERPDLFNTQDCAAAIVMRVLQAKQLRGSNVFVAVIGNNCSHLPEIEHATLVGPYHHARRAAKRRSTALLVEVNMRLIANNKSFTSSHV